MQWYQYIAVFFAGAFWANAVPHFVHGISGNKFPTPFAKPPGKGLSSALTNMLWALFNIVIAYLLSSGKHIDREHPLMLILFFLGIAAVGIMGSINFRNKHKEQ